MPTRRLLTLHAPLGRILSDSVMEAISSTLRIYGVERWWISLDYLPDAVIMADVPDEQELLDAVTR